MAIDKALIDSLESGQLNPQTGLTGDFKNSDVKKGFEKEILDLADNTYKPDPSIGSGYLDYDHTKFRNYGGMPSGIDLEEYRASNQSVGEQLAFGAGRLVGTTATKFLTGIGYALSGIPAILNGDINVMLDNGWSGAFTDAEEWIKEDFLPIHHKRRYLDGNVFEQMGTMGFWMDDVMDGSTVHNIIHTETHCTHLFEHITVYISSFVVYR